MKRKLIAFIMAIVLTLGGQSIRAFAIHPEEETHMSATTTATWKIYGQDGSVRREFWVNKGTVVGPGSTDTYWQNLYGQSPVSAGQAGLNLVKVATNLTYNSLGVDGVFGSLTANATRAFQSYANANYSSMSIDGWIGDDTWEALEYYSALSHAYHRIEVSA